MVCIADFNSILKYVILIVVGVGVFKYINNPEEYQSSELDYTQQQFEQIEEGEISLFSKNDYNISANHEQQIARAFPRKIKVPISGGNKFIRVTDIIYCESDGKNVKIVTESDAEPIIATRISLTNIKQKIGDAPFIYRELKSYIINFEYVDKVISNPNNHYSTSIILENKKVISLPKGKEDDFTTDIEKYFNYL